MVISLVLIIMMTLAIAASAFYWIMKIQGQMYAGSSEAQAGIRRQVTGELSIVDIQYNVNTDTARIVMENSGSRLIERIGSVGDTIVISKPGFSCDISFDSSACDSCPFDLEVGEIRKLSLDFIGSDCSNLREGFEYSAYFALSDSSAKTSFVPVAIYDSWTLMTPRNSPTGRYTHKMAAIDGTDKVLLFGGNPGASYVNETWIYDHSENNWTNLSLLVAPSLRYGHSIATIDGIDKILLFGGFDGSGNCDGSGNSYCNGTWLYDLSANTWNLMIPASSPSIRDYHAMATIDGTDKILLFGGQNPGFTENDETWVYNYTDNNWYNVTPAISPSARQAHAMATIDGTDKILLFGGNGPASGYLDETWVYDLSDNTWTQVNTAIRPRGRQNHAMATIDGTDKILLFSGLSGNTRDDETWLYDYSGSTWSLKVPRDKPKDRELHAMTSIDGTDKVLLFGGYTGNKSDETWIYV